jgi:hypothetical protein
MISPKEEAKELIEKYLKLDIEIGGQYDGYLTMKMHDAKECALIAVDKILKVAFFAHDDIYNHYLEVKIELEKL